MLISDKKKDISVASKKKKTKILILILDIIIGIIIVILFISYLITQVSGYKDRQYFINDSLIKRTTNAIINNEGILFDENEFNAVLNNVILKNVTLPETIKSITVVPSDSDNCIIFVPFEYKGINLEYSIKSNVSLNKDEKMINFKVLETKLGKLPVPKNIFFKYINNGSIKYKDEILFIKSNVTFEILNVKAECELSELKIKNSKFYLEFKTNMDEMRKLFIRKIDKFLNNIL